MDQLDCDMILAGQETFVSIRSRLQEQCSITYGRESDANILADQVYIDRQLSSQFEPQSLYFN
eukprot:3135715-Ditylum_brightwellii.AAC.1